MVQRFICLFFMIPLFGAYSQSFRSDLKRNLSLRDNQKEYLLKLIIKENSNINLSILQNELGLVYQKAGNLDSAKFYHTRALKAAQDYSLNNEEIAISYNKIAIIHFYNGGYDSAIFCLKKALPFFTDKSLKANTLNNLALANKYIGNPEISIENYLKALTLFKEENNKKKVVVLLNNIGSLHYDLNEFIKAENYFEKALRLARENDNKNGEITSKSNLANLYKDKGYFIKAAEYYKESIIYYETVSDYNNLIAIKNNLAVCFGEMGYVEKEILTYEEILDLMHQTGYTKTEEAILINLATVYHDRNKFEHAIQLFIQAYKIIREKQSITYLETVYSSLSESYKSLNQLDSSIYYKDLQIALNDSLDMVEKEKKAMELETEYQNSELTNSLTNAQTELKQTEKQKSLFTKGLIIVILCLFFAILGTVVIYKRYRNKKELSEELTAKNTLNTQNIKELKSSLGDKDQEIEKLSHLEKTGKLPFPKNLEVLTQREKEVLIGVQEGLKDQEIADKLFISITTVRTHLRKAYVKIDARNRAEAIQFISKFEA